MWMFAFCCISFVVGVLSTFFYLDVARAYKEAKEKKADFNRKVLSWCSPVIRFFASGGAMSLGTVIVFISERQQTDDNLSVVRLAESVIEHLERQAMWIKRCELSDDLNPSYIITESGRKYLASIDKIREALEKLEPDIESYLGSEQ